MQCKAKEPTSMPRPKEEENDEGNDPVFTTLGMFIIDEIHYPTCTGIPPQHDIIGGGGTYAALGSRLISGASLSHRDGWIIDKGSDFPDSVEDEIQSWHTGVKWREDRNRLTTRGWNYYGEREFRDFKYLSPRLRIVAEDIISDIRLLRSESFHLISHPERAFEIITDIDKARYQAGIKESAVFTWEPVPDSCTAANLPSLLEVLPYVDIFSPNAEEASRLFGLCDEPSGKEELEAVAARFKPYLTKQNKYGTAAAVVLRCGALGSLSCTEQGQLWYPAYHGSQNPTPQVVDPTGGGNTYLGSFTTAFVLGKGDYQVASIAGNVGAGVAIEQVGVPKLTGYEVWGGVPLKDRVRHYCAWNGISMHKRAFEWL